MKRPRLTFRQWVGYAGFALVFLLVAALAVWRGDILRAGLDPQVPFQIYEPPPPPDYARPGTWALNEARMANSESAAIFFIHSTTFDGGGDWNGPVGDAQSDAHLFRVVLPNYAGPFARAGAISAPRYRQSSLYSRLTLRDDAREARAFAYQDIEQAFDVWLTRHPDGPIVLAGVEQGGELAERLLRERVAPDPALRRRLVAAYFIDALVARERLSPTTPPCRDQDQTGCVVGWGEVAEKDDGSARRRLRRALIWDDAGKLVAMAENTPLCVNPVSGSDDAAPTDARRHHGATNATGLEWGARPALMAREVSAQCRQGLLRHSQPTSESFRSIGGWADRRKSKPYNLFYGDIEADVQARLASWQARR